MGQNFFVEQWRNSMSYHFVPECNHTQENRKMSIFSILSAIFSGQWFVLLLPRQQEEMTSPLS